MSGDSWQPIKTAPRDGRPFLFCAAGDDLIYIGAIRRPIAGNVRDAECLCYLSYTDTNGKTFFRAGGMIRCGLEATFWRALPAPPSQEPTA